MKRYLCVLFVVALLCKVNAKTKWYDVGDVAQRAQEIYIDYNKDGEITCIDRAVAFKLVWDKTYRHNRCELVRNYNPGKLNHLFVRVWLAGGRFSYMLLGEQHPNMWLYLEPTYDSIYAGHDMKAAWGDRYDPAYNYYGETDYWLRKCGIIK